MVNQVDAASVAKLPTRLGKEPLVDAMFELRVATDVSLAGVMPGVLFGHLKNKGGSSFSKMAGSDFPEQIKQLNPEMAYVPQVCVDVADFRILLGDNSIAINCKLPYKGGKHLKAFILEIAELLASLGVVKRIERYSFKYIDIVAPLDALDLSTTLKVDLSVGGQVVAGENASIRVEFPFSNGGVHVVGIASQALISLVTGETRQGAMIDIDSLVFYQSDDVAGFFAGLADRLSDLKQKNKEIFFGCLTVDAIKSLEPEYV